ncbi:tRNA lysidine(34) synthetase TilS [Limibaculum sp. M0105]|uniref:tRNA(Ile)-lysidine synthase n=1 Tax=Thermohalobaculum xanthum TaxID=2753746 RepID=A0A8J7M7K8_9RHOB|nr:tRNA lysidine(34) synthetase TilS [Thermohalobaculum xanthum]MBK0399352.1 tRNA lysidine(34) synthetase TilS [Thermohalobaculum xanthum]
MPRRPRAQGSARGDSVGHAADDAAARVLSDAGEAIAAALDRLAPSGRLGVAVSGGGDSMALLVAAHDWAAARGRGLSVATIDHGLRPEAAAEALQVARLAQGMGLSHATLKVASLPPGNVNARARDARHRLLADWARAEGLAAVLLGHTLDDQAETVLMRLGRGSGADGLSAMAEATQRLGLSWLRPALSLRRADLRRWLEARGVAWIEDPTNEDVAHQRVRVRRALTVLEEAGIHPEMIAASASRLRAQRRVLDGVTADLAADALELGPGGALLVDRARLAAADPEIAGRMIAACIMAITGADYAPRGAALAALIAGLSLARPRGATLGGVIARPARRGRVLLCREPAAVAPEVAIGPRGATWDARWQVDPFDGADVTLGALGSAGVRDLPPALRPAGWDDMAHVVRLTLPAIRHRGNLVGVPQPRGDMPLAETPGFAVLARNLVRERLPFTQDRR